MKVESCLLKAYPDGPLEANQFEFASEEVESFKLQNGQILIKLIHVSVDPYMRGQFKQGAGHFHAFEIGKPIESPCVAEVIESKNSEFPVGSLVTGSINWVTMQVVDTEGLKILPNLPGVPSSYFLGILGLTGLTAYFPFKEYTEEFLTAKEKEGSVVFVSGAAGAVGSVFAQLCKSHLKNCTLLGSAGSQEKVDLCKKELGYDDVVNYKGGIAKGLDAVLKGREIDLYYDNVGGEMLDEVLVRMRSGGKIICCGAISDYDVKEENKYALKNYFNICTRSLTVQGFTLFQFLDQAESAGQALGALLQSGDLKAQETVLHGFDKVLDGLIGLFNGTNAGKMIISI